METPRHCDRESRSYRRPGVKICLGPGQDRLLLKPVQIVLDLVAADLVLERIKPLAAL
jgi:hypothetical protein